MLPCAPENLSLSLSKEFCMKILSERFPNRNGERNDVWSIPWRVGAGSDVVHESRMTVEVLEELQAGDGTTVPKLGDKCGICTVFLRARPPPGLIDCPVGAGLSSTMRAS